jgi:hypothetical protein
MLCVLDRVLNVTSSKSLWFARNAEPQLRSGRGLHSGCLTWFWSPKEFAIATSRDTPNVAPNPNGGSIPGPNPNGSTGTSPNRASPSASKLFSQLYRGPLSRDELHQDRW